MSSSAIQKLQSAVEEAWEDRARLSPGSAPAKTRRSVARVLDEPDQGRLRVAEKLDGAWPTHQWLKKAGLLSCPLADNRPRAARRMRVFDRVPTQVRGDARP